MQFINVTHLKNSPLIKNEFEANNPLDQFVVIDDFLNDTYCNELLEEIIKVPYATWCAFSRKNEPTNITACFCKPSPGYYYMTIHDRPIKPISTLDKLAKSFSDEKSIKQLSLMTGLNLSKRLEYNSNLLTRWGPGQFINSHTDYGDIENPTKLVISLSLTKSWSVQKHNGQTYFLWDNVKNPLMMVPKLNQAILFKPEQNRFHWVQQISHTAPANRFTFTLHFI